MGKRIYFHAFWPFIYTKTEVLSRKTIISKNSGQSGDFWKLRFCVCVWTRSNGVLGSQTSQYATKNASHHVSVLCLQLVCLLIMDAVKVVLIYTLMQTPVCIYKHNCFSIWRSRGEELHGGQQSFYCFHSQDVGYIACQRRHRRFWIRPGRTAVWWENFEKEVVLPDEWHENFRMSRSSLLSLSELLHPSIEGRIYAGSCKQKLFWKRSCVYDVIFENGGAEIFVSVNTRLCVNVEGHPIRMKKKRETWISSWIITLCITYL